MMRQASTAAMVANFLESCVLVFGRKSHSFVSHVGFVGRDDKLLNTATTFVKFKVLYYFL